MIGNCPVCGEQITEFDDRRVHGTGAPRYNRWTTPESGESDPIRDGEVVHIKCKGRPFRVWHDDIRRPPSDKWIWARTNAEAIAALRGGGIYSISLDHDLGYHGLDPALYDSPESLEDAAEATGVEWSQEDGRDLVRHMIEHELVPREVRIHSWNPPAAASMAAMLRDHGHDPLVRPFSDDERASDELKA